MYQLLRSVPTRQLLIRQLPSFLVAFLIAEIFYKFHSFALECAAFLVTWLAIDALAELAAYIRRSLRGDHSAGNLND